MKLSFSLKEKIREISSGSKPNNATMMRSLFSTRFSNCKETIPIHPGEILLEEFMKPVKISQYKLAKGLYVGPIRISEIIHGKRSITADTLLLDWGAISKWKPSSG